MPTRESGAEDDQDRRDAAEHQQSESGQCHGEVRFRADGEGAASTSSAAPTAKPARRRSGHSNLAMPHTARATTATATTSRTAEGGEPQPEEHDEAPLETKTAA